MTAHFYQEPKPGQVDVCFWPHQGYLIRRCIGRDWPQPYALQFWQSRSRSWVTLEENATRYRFWANASRVAETLRALEGLARL
jgi:hypothetical protein